MKLRREERKKARIPYELPLDGSGLLGRWRFLGGFWESTLGRSPAFWLDPCGSRAGSVATIRPRSFYEQENSPKEGNKRMLTEQEHVGEDEGKVDIRSPRVKRDYGPMATLPVWGWCGYGITLHVMGANGRFQSFPDIISNSYNTHSGSEPVSTAPNRALVCVDDRMWC